MSCLRQDEELLGHVQSAILQVQGDCEKLNITTSNLIEDHRQKQKDINVRGRQGGCGREGPRLPFRPCSLSRLRSLGLPGAVPGSREAREGKGQQGPPGYGD